jgi:tetratricopeptide (TPR) repeat protein
MLRKSWICAGFLCVLTTAAQGQRLSDVVYMDQPTGVALSTYVSTWPALEPYVTRLKASQTDAVEADLRRRFAAGDASDGEMNLLAQLEWLRGDLDAADLAAAKAVALNPRQALNLFQLAMVDFAHLRKASGMFGRWTWQQRTADAYQRTFDADPHNVSARYYLAYSFMNTPAIGGGDLNKALALADGGIALGQIGFYAVRADAHRMRGERDAANADYDTAIKLRVIKLGGLLDAAAAEVALKNWDRAKRYLDWAVYCRPDSTKAYEGLGDYYVALNDLARAREAYEAALRNDAANKSVADKLARLAANP